jgi:hypothetical protein
MPKLMPRASTLDDWWQVGPLPCRDVGVHDRPHAADGSAEWVVRLIFDAVSPGHRQRVRCSGMTTLINLSMPVLAAGNPSGAPTWLTIVTLLVATLSMAGTVGNAWLAHRNRLDVRATRRRDETARLYELSRRLHEDLTTGEVEQARSVLGHVVRSNHMIGGKTERKDALNSYFQLLWCFERIYAAQCVITESGISDAEAFFRQLFKWHVDEWRESIHGDGRLRERLKKALGTQRLDDRQSLKSFNAVCRYFDEYHSGC